MAIMERPMSAEELQGLPRTYWRGQFDQAARAMVGMSGSEFIERWDAGEFDDLETEDYELYSSLSDLAAMSGLGRF